MIRSRRLAGYPNLALDFGEHEAYYEEHFRMRPYVRHSYERTSKMDWSDL